MTAKHRDVVLFGTTDFGRVAAAYLSEDSPYKVAAFTVHERFRRDESFAGRPVVPFEKILESHPPDRFAMFVAVGFKRVNAVRKEIYGECKRLGYELISYVNSRATHWGEVAIGDNCFVFENNVIQPFVRIGNDVILWSGNHIGHDSTIADHCFIASHVVISGNVSVGESCFLGVNATVRDGVKIAPRCVIGAGALIMKDTVEGGVYAAKGSEPRPEKSWELSHF